MSDIEESAFGQHNGKAVQRYTLKNRRGFVLDVTNYGATLVGLQVPDRQGRLADVVLGFDDVQGYIEHQAFFGATVGRVANRIRDAAFSLEGKQYRLAATDGAHHLHGGRSGWDRAVWQAQASEAAQGPSVELSYCSPDGEEGYPGRVDATTTYTLTHEGALLISMRARTDRSTIINMVHHTYWNLGGHAAGDVLDHELMLAAEFYTPGDPVVPVGQLERVANTPFDFREPKAIGVDLGRAGGTPVGFDHNWVLGGVVGALRPVAQLRHPKSGRTLSLQSDAPGIQFYSGNFLNGSITGKGGQKYEQYAGLCLETQAFPNSINVPEWEGQVIAKPDQEYRHEMLFRFSAD